MILTLLAWCGPAWAHDLKADYRVLPDKKVWVESWFETDEPAAEAVVEVVRVKDGTPLFRGKTDDKGVCVFGYAEAEDLRVRIFAGAGHAASLTIPASRLQRPDAEGTVQREGKSAVNAGSSKVPPVDRSVRAGDVLKDVLVGVGFLLALAAFVISLRNAHRIKQMGQRILETERQNTQESS
jgi:hypothetical protein